VNSKVSWKTTLALNKSGAKTSSHTDNYLDLHNKELPEEVILEAEVVIRRENH
tara:strand:- start:161 stop:319 length:159 start_codon:yes stop_codon:yes gene_type:complete